MPLFDVLVTRDTSESVTIRVEAAEGDTDAIDQALLRARSDFALVWTPDDTMGGEPYIADQDDAVSAACGPDALEVLAQAYLNRTAAAGTELRDVMLIEDHARIFWIQRQVEVFGRGIADNTGHLDVSLTDLASMPAVDLVATRIAREFSAEHSAGEASDDELTDAERLDAILEINATEADNTGSEVADYMVRAARATTKADLRAIIKEAGPLSGGDEDEE